MEYGTIRIKLDELLKKSGLSKNMLSHKAEMQRTQLTTTAEIRSRGWISMSLEDYVPF